jgi:glucosylceramidase
VEYYILGHISKFVAPGAHRIDSNTFGPGSIEDVAFQNPDGSIVVLVLNSAAAQNTFSIRFKGNAFSYSLPAGALATFVWK